MKILDVSSFEKLKINPMSLDDFDNINFHSENKYGISEKDMIDDLKGIPIGVAVRMLEETEKQGNRPSVKPFQIEIDANFSQNGFDWLNTEAARDKEDFWCCVLRYHDFDIFFEKYPEYKKYN